MSEQKGLPFAESIQQRFEAYHAAHPEVYAALVRFTHEAKQTSPHAGIRMIWERMRWFMYIERRQADSEFKLNDHFTSRYARLIMEQEPDLAGVFELRGLRA